MNIQIESQPHSKEAEAALLGSVLLYPQAYHEAAKHINSTDFYVIKNQWVWQAYDALMHEHTAIDIVTVSGHLESVGKLTEIGGDNYLIELVSGTPTAMHAEAYAKDVAQFADRRRALLAANELAKAAYDTENGIDEFIPKYITNLLALIKTENKTSHIKGILSELYDDIQSRYENPQDIYGIPTGINGIDAITGGMQKGEVFLLSGEPGAGKSLLAMQIAFHMAKSEHPGVIYELEMSGLMTLRRSLSVESSVAVRAMKTGRMGEGEWFQVNQAIQRMEAYPVYFSSSTSWTTAGLRADLVRLKQLNKIEWFVVDYLRLIKDRFEGKEPERIGYLLSNIHDICKDLELSGLVIQSMTKEGMKDGGMTGVYGGSEMSHAADIIAVLTKTEEKTLDSAEKVKLKFEKFRESDCDTNLVQLVKKPGFPAFGELAKSSYSK
jgi:replicative DNA helicase